MNVASKINIVLSMKLQLKGKKLFYVLLHLVPIKFLIIKSPE